MSWKKYMRPHGDHIPTTVAPLPDYDAGRTAAGTSGKYASYLPEVYAGHPNRLQRYTQYEEMNRDSFIRTALDTLAEFCTQSEEANECPFDIQFLEEANETEVKLLNESMQIWITLNDFPSRLFTMFRNTLMNGDSFYLRDPETKEWTHLDHYSVTMAKVDDQNGRKITEYMVRGFDDFKQAKFSTVKADLNSIRGNGGQQPAPFAMNSYVSGSGGASSFQIVGAEKNQRTSLQKTEQDIVTIDSKHVIHLSMSDGLDINWPFGPSILESVFKVWKQKELLEDAIIIYRVSRAPERRVFYVDVGQSNPVVARGIVEAVKNDIHSRRIPNAMGGGQSMLDAAHNPLSMLDDYFLPQSSEGRGSKVEVLPGGDSVGEITDLSYFMRALAAAFKIPQTYLPFYANDTTGGASYNDGKLGTATIQEFMFNKYCMRLQNKIITEFDSDFKRFLKERSIEIESTLFKLKFCPPQNFTKYREVELQTQRVNLFTQIVSVPFIAKSFAMKKYLDLSEDEMIENEIAWAKENPGKIKDATGQTSAERDEEGALADVGIRGGMGMGMGGDMDFGGEEEGLGGDAPVGDPAAADLGAGAPPAPGGGGMAPTGPTGPV